MKIRVIMTLIPALLLASLMVSCNTEAQRNEKMVAVYTSVDQVFSEKVFKDFENKTGIKVLPVYDVEATKTIGLTNRLIAEKTRPQADVFWNGEFANTLLLKEKGVLEKYRSPSASGIPKRYVDSEGYWTGFGGRVRVILVNTRLLKPEDFPESINDLFNTKYDAAKIGISSPLFGTTATFAAAMYSLQRPEQARNFFSRIKERNIEIFQGNSVVKDMVASGKIAFGLVDSDDAYASIKKGDPVKIIVPDQKPGEPGTLIIPNTAALIAKAPHPEAGKKFLDYLLSEEVESNLIDSEWIDVSVRDVDAERKLDIYKNIVPMNVDFNDVYKQMENAKKDMTGIFVN